MATPPPPMDLEALRHRLDAALSRRPRRALDRSDLISAAVLVPVTDRSGPHVLFTKKTGSVPHHKGQFSFPGGVVETRDGARVETALREAWEEIRLPAEAVEVLGLLDDTETRATNFIITPVVVWAGSVGALTPNPAEVAKIFRVPLDDLEVQQREQQRARDIERVRGRGPAHERRDRARHRTDEQRRRRAPRVPSPPSRPARRSVSRPSCSAARRDGACRGR